MRSITDSERAGVLDAEVYREEREQYVTRMEADGFEILVPEGNELQIDLDSASGFYIFLRRWERFAQEYENASWRAYPSKSGLPHRHVVVSLPFGVNAAERIALQAILGSDPTREMLSVFRYYRGDPCPTLLARKAQGSSQ